MLKALSIILKNFQSKIPPNDAEIKSLLDGIESVNCLINVRVPSEVESCLAFLCSRYSIQGTDKI